MPSARLFASASAPTQSAANSTGAPSKSASFAATGRKLYFGSGLPFGRPRCEASTSRAPRSRASFSVGSVSAMRVSSVTLPVLERHVEIHAHEDALPREIEIANRKFGHRADDSVGKIGAYSFAAMNLIRSRQRHE